MFTDIIADMDITLRNEVEEKLVEACEKASAAVGLYLY
jgi:hypothetical protein